MTGILIALIGLSIGYAAVINTNPKDDKIFDLNIRSDEVDKTFNHNYETLSGTKVEQYGHLKQITPNETGNSVEGRYSYIGDDGQEYKVSYTAGEFGYQPSGRHIPSIPPAIKKALAYNAEHSSSV